MHPGVTSWHVTWSALPLEVVAHGEGETQAVLASGAHRSWHLNARPRSASEAHSSWALGWVGPRHRALPNLRAEIFFPPRLNLFSKKSATTLLYCVCCNFLLW